MMEVQQQLAEIANSTAISARPGAYLSFLKSIISQPSSKLSSAALKQHLSIYLDEAVFSDANSQGGGLIVGRQVLSDFNDTIAEERRVKSEDGDAVMKSSGDEPAIKDEDTRREILEDALEKTQPRVLSFEEQSSSLRLHLSDLLENAEVWLEAAKVLQGIPLGSGHRSVSNLYKLRIYIRIVRLLLEGDDAVGADTFLKRASMVIHAVPGAATSRMRIETAEEEDRASKASEEEKVEARALRLQYKLCQARIYDAQRRFAEAAIRFHEVSYVAEIDEGERTMMLSAAVTASILAPAGPLRSRILATLVRDERTAALPQHTILTKVFLDQIIRPNEIAAFEKLLGPHQRAKLPKSTIKMALVSKDEDYKMNNGNEEDEEDEEAESERNEPSTVLDRAMMEHNVLATSKLYSNITFRGLGGLLDLSRVGAETMVRKMIVQKRLRAEIDQVEGLVIFGEQVEREGGVAGTGAKKGETSEERDQEENDPDAIFTKRWDASIARTSSAVEDLCAKLRSRGLVSI